MRRLLAPAAAALVLAASAAAATPYPPRPAGSGEEPTAGSGTGAGLTFEPRFALATYDGSDYVLYLTRTKLSCAQTLLAAPPYLTVTIVTGAPLVVGAPSVNRGDTAFVSGRRPGESILAAFTDFAVGSQGSGLLADEQASDRLRSVVEMIAASDTLRAHEEAVFARFTASLAELIREETGARAGDVEPNVVAHALIGFHRSLVDHVRRGTLAGTPNATIARGVRIQARHALARLEHGLGDYGVRPS